MKTSSYSPGQKFLHWLSAVVILWALITGFYVALIPAPLELKEWVAFVNVSLTTLFVPFFVLRLFLSLRQRRLEGVKYRSPMERLAVFVHRLIYLVVTAVLVTGFLMMDRAITVFDLFFIPPPLENPDWITLFFKVHIWSCAVLALLVALHVGAVIKHELSGRRVLQQMSWRS